MKTFRKLNGYILRYCPSHPRAFTKGKAERNGQAGYIYEHILVADRELGRPLIKGEEVHHLDLVRSNNRPSNLIVLLTSEHMKLHAWLDNIGITCENVTHTERTYVKIPRCKNCKFPLNSKKRKHCSKACLYERNENKLKSKADKSKLHKLLTKYSFKRVGEYLGLSDNGVRKYAIRLGLDPKYYAKLAKRRKSSSLSPEHKEKLSKSVRKHYNNIEFKKLHSGENNKTAVLTNKQARRIRKYWKTGEYTKTSLAEFYGVSHATIRYVISGKGYKYA